MSKIKTAKTYDCVDEVRKIRTKIAKDVKDISTEEAVAYYAQKAKNLKSRS